MAPITVSSSPRLGCAWAPTDSILSMTAWMSSSEAVGFITIIMGWFSLYVPGVASLGGVASRTRRAVAAALDPRVRCGRPSRPAERLAKSPIPGVRAAGDARRGHGAGVRDARIEGLAGHARRRIVADEPLAVHAHVPAGHLGLEEPEQPLALPRELLGHLLREAAERVQRERRDLLGGLCLPRPGHEAVDQERRLDAEVAAWVEERPVLVGDDPAAVVVGQQQAVEVGQEPDGRGRAGVGPRGVREIEQLAPAVVGERRELVAHPLEHRLEVPDAGTTSARRPPSPARTPRGDGARAPPALLWPSACGPATPPRW